VKNNSNKE